MDSLDDINHQSALLLIKKTSPIRKSSRPDTHAFIDELELITPGKLNASKGSPY